MRAWHLVVALLLVTAVACGGNGDDPAVSDDATGGDPTAGNGASVAFVTPEDGATVTSPVDVEMEATGIEIEEAGVVREGAGHFHIMVDTDCVPAGEIIATDDQHLHFGDASTTTQIELPAGQHTLCLQAADGAHTAYDATDTITITVE